MKNTSSETRTSKFIDKRLYKLGWIFERFFGWLIKILCKILDISHSDLMKISVILSVFSGGISFYLAAKPYWVKHSIEDIHTLVFLGTFIILKWILKNSIDYWGVHDTEVKNKFSIKDRDEFNKGIKVIRRLNNIIIFSFLIIIILSFLQDPAEGVYMSILWFSSGIFLNLISRDIEK